MLLNEACESRWFRGCSEELLLRPRLVRGETKERAEEEEDDRIVAAMGERRAIDGDEVMPMDEAELNC